MKIKTYNIIAKSRFFETNQTVRGEVASRKLCKQLKQLHISHLEQEAKKADLYIRIVDRLAFNRLTVAIETV